MQRPTIQKPTPRAPSGLPGNVSLGNWGNDISGEKVIVYAESGMGKTTLATMAPEPAFIGLDDGGRKLRNPITNEPLMCLQINDKTAPNGARNPRTFEEVRALIQAAIDLPCQSVVLDTATKLEPLAEDYVLRTVAGPQGARAANLEAYGYGKGYKHLYDAMGLPLLDFDRLVATGKNVIVLCQSINAKVANPEGEDFVRDDLRLYHSNSWSVRSQWAEWADHVLRIAYQGVFVNKQNKQDRTGKAAGDTTRVIHADAEVYFRAKSRTLGEPVISFSEPGDDSLWRLMFDSEEQ